MFITVKNHYNQETKVINNYKPILYVTMKKPFDFRKVDLKRRCIDCNAPLKLNLLAKVPEAPRCYVCYILKTNNLNVNRKRLLALQKRNKISYQS